MRWEEKLNEETCKRKREKKPREGLLIGKRKDKKGKERKGGFEKGKRSRADRGTREERERNRDREKKEEANELDEETCE